MMAYLQQALKRYFGYDTFLSGQQEVIEHVLVGHDALVLMPTGGGKSLTYQLPAMLLPGLTVVVSPLIALMQDQVHRLNLLGIPAACITSISSEQERIAGMRAALSGQAKLLYVAPERLMSGSFLTQLDQMQKQAGLSLIAVDEAHCVSEWGHDFRPEYRQLGQLRARYPQAYMLALTATATERVRSDIQIQLHLHDPLVYVASFNRPNLYYEVRSKHRGSYRELLQILREKAATSVIIYCQTRSNVEELHRFLTDNGIQALPYHAGISNTERIQNQERFICGDIPVLVATIAFGMGIAKPDVRAVIHFDIPRNLESYYQESGRAGRDGQQARCIIFFEYAARFTIEHWIAEKTNKQEQRIALQQLHQMLDYCNSSVCRRRVLLSYFGEMVEQENCGNCDHCLNPTLWENHTKEAQQFFSCVALTHERFGMRYIIDVLRGARIPKISDYGHHQLPVYGIGNYLSLNEWLHIGRSLLHQGLMCETADGYPVLKLNSLSKEIMQGLRLVQVARYTQSERKQKEESPLLDQASLGVFQHLRLLRNIIAQQRGFPAYIVFPDETLRIMARLRPQSRALFARIPGVGDQKLEEYFTLFTREIKAYCEQHKLDMEVGEPPLTPMCQRTLDLYRQGLSVHEIAWHLHRSLITVVKYLVDLIEHGESIDVVRLVSQDRHAVILEALQRVGTVALRPVKDDLGEDYSFEEIKLVRAAMRRDRQA
jgi:ATP-dependent DNA helicase RecQ